MKRVGGVISLWLLTVRFPIYLSSRLGLDEIGISEPDSSNTAAFLRQIAGAVPLAEERASFQQMMSSKNSMIDLLMNANLPLVDYREKRSAPAKRRFGSFLKAISRTMKMTMTKGE